MNKSQTLHSECDEFKKSKKKTKQDKNRKNTYIYGFIFIIFTLILEIANFLRLGFGFFPVNFGIEISIIIMLAGLIFLVPTKTAKIILTIILFTLQVALNIANASVIKSCGEIVTFEMIFTQGFETIDVFEFNQLDLPALIISFVIIVAFILSMVFVPKRMPKIEIKNGAYGILMLVFLTLCVETIGFCSLSFFKMGYFNSEASAESLVDSNEYWFDSINNKYASFKKFGFWSFYFNNASVFLKYEDKLSNEEMKDLNIYIEDGENYLNSNSIFEGQNLSGSLQGDNLIMIMMESIEWFAIDEFNTPQLYNFISNDALAFTKYYSRNKTNVSEQISVLGNIPNQYSLKTIHNKVGFDDKYSLPTLFKNNGYESVNYFHDYKGVFYDRNNLNVAMGFDDVYSMEDCPIEFEPRFFGDFLDDGDYIREMMDLFAPKDKSFFNFFTTVTTHGPYDKSNDRFEHYYQKFDDNYENYKVYAQSQGWATPEVGSFEYKLIREYKSKAMAVEHAFIEIDNYLNSTYDENGTLLKDNTTIVMFADHNAYYSDLTEVVKGIDKNDKNKDQYNVPLIIYNSKLGNGKVDTFCTTYDLYPTICDLYGISYNKNLIQGHSIFSEDIDKSVFVSFVLGMFDENYYTVTLDDFTPANQEVHTEENLKKFKSNLSKFLYKQDMIDKYYRINYHKTTA